MINDHDHVKKHKTDATHIFDTSTMKISPLWEIYAYLSNTCAKDIYWDRKQNYKDRGKHSSLWYSRYILNLLTRPIAVRILSPNFNKKIFSRIILWSSYFFFIDIQDDINTVELFQWSGWPYKTIEKKKNHKYKWFLYQ